MTGPHWNSITFCIITEALSYVCTKYFTYFFKDHYILLRISFAGGHLTFLSYLFLCTRRSLYFTGSCSQDFIDYVLSVWNTYNKITGFHTIRKEWKHRVGKTNSRHSANQIRTRLMSLLALIILLLLAIVCIIALFLKKMFLKSFSKFVYPWGWYFVLGL